LVLLDLSMPLLNGAEAAVVLKRMMPQTEIILFTMHGGNVGETLTATADIDLVLSKTDGIVKFEEHLNALLTPTVDENVPRRTPGSRRGRILFG
jgi:DNA-binding NarL/FixJ family response regulator